MASLLADHYTQVGSAETEVFDTKKGAVKFLDETIDQVAGKLEMRNRRTRMEPQGNLMLVHELCDVYVLADTEWTFYSKFRASTLMQIVSGRWKIIHQHSSFPDARTGEGENIAAEKIEEENQQLREAVKRRTIELQHKNLELEIEAALERVRAAAMGMKQPADMLEICRTISLELASLGVKGIRNVQTAIFYPQRGAYMNYEYYARHKKTFITETTYTNNTIHKAFAMKMLRGEGEFFTTHIKGKKVKDWLAYQKTTNVFIDKYLKTAPSLNYYWYSLGSVAMGISSYSPLRDNDLNLFKRFRNVFELAYSRYTDIEKAEAQAHEARIETALERVRAVAMAMRTADDLSAIGKTIFTELKSLAFEHIRNTEIVIIHNEKHSVTTYHYSDYGQEEIIDVDYTTHPIIQQWVKDLQKAPDAFVPVSIPQQQMKSWNRYRKELGYQNDPGMARAKTVYYYSYSIGLGALSISTWQPIADEQIKMLERFRNVFHLSYQRYKDVAQAETHGKESRIELSLERVRARSMGMHRSDELFEAADVVFQQLKELGIESIRTGIATFDEVQKTVTVWSRAHADKPLTKILGVVPKNSHSFFAGAFDAWKAKKKFYFQEFTGSEVVRYYRKMSSVLSYPPSKTRNPKEVFYTFFFPEGSVNVVRREKLADDEVAVMLRFASVFGLMYRRFLDLQKAEAQAREAQIQLALERVRARSLAMHHTSELQEVVNIAAQQLHEISIDINGGVFIAINNEVDQDIPLWASSGVTDYSQKVIGPSFDKPIFARMRGAIKKGNNFLIEEYSKEEKIEFFQHLFRYSPWNAVSEERKNELLSREGGYTRSVAIAQHTSIAIQNHNGKQFTDEDNEILKRFSNVFEQSYTRFLDLQKAEAQVREAQIEAALERVRSSSLAMHRSDELQGVVNTVIERLKELNIILDTTNILFFNNKGRSIEYWTGSNSTGTQLNASWKVPFTDFSYFKDIRLAHDTEQALFIGFYPFEEKNKIFTYLFSETDFRNLNPERKKFIFENPRATIVAAIVKDIAIQVISYSRESFAPDEMEIVKRFAKVFHQAYIRFFDLQKAEAQAREAQIEAALEKVRSRSLAMHKSDEIGEVVWTVVEKMKELNIELGGISIVTFIPGSKDLLHWYVNPEQAGNSSTMRMPYFDNLILNDTVDAREKGMELLVKIYSKEEKNDYFNAAVENSDFKYFPDEIKQWLLNQPYLGFSYAIQKHSGIYLEDYAGKLFSTEENNILIRFSKVFEQSYVRFLDLQKAETQAKEAQIEAALERVRSRSMGMQKSEELKRGNPGGLWPVRSLKNQCGPCRLCR